VIPSAAAERDLARAGWRRMPLAAELVFFVLTAFAILAFFALCHLWGLPEGVTTAVVAIGVAEWLIRRHRFWRTGVESALWIGGLVAVIASLPRSGRPEAVLVFAAAAALAGWRLRNPVFGTAAAALVIAYPAARHSAALAIVASAATGLAAAVATTAVWRRSSTGRLVDFVAVVAPLAGFVVGRTFLPWRPSDVRSSDAGVVAVFLALALLDLVVGIRYRVRAPLIAAAVALALALVEAHDFVRLSLEAELILGGLTALATASLLLRALRGRTTGIVATTVDEPELAEAVQTVTMLGTAVAPGHGAPHPGAQPGPEPPPERGGRFGGGGASDRF
jgi:hypothetical protein